MSIRKTFLSSTILGLLSALALTSTSYACDHAAPVTSAAFCSTFKDTAACVCVNNGLSAKRCQDINFIYRLSVDLYGNLDRVCNLGQNMTSPQECIDNWNCYLHGGYTSDGQPCSGTGRACA